MAIIGIIAVLGATVAAGFAGKYLLKSAVESPSIMALADGATYAIPGAGLTYVGIKTQNKNLKLGAIAGGVGLMGYGAYKMYKNSKSVSGGVMPPPDASFPLIIEKPGTGEDFYLYKWSYFPYLRLVRAKNQIILNVQNPYDTKYNIFVGVSMRNPTGNWHHFEMAFGSLKPFQALELPFWKFYGTPDDSGLLGTWLIRASVWRELPEGNCEAEGTCHRLSSVEKFVEFKEIR